MVKTIQSDLARVPETVRRLFLNGDGCHKQTNADTGDYITTAEDPGSGFATSTAMASISLKRHPVAATTLAACGDTT
jgi:hypothetical protein